MPFIILPWCISNKLIYITYIYTLRILWRVSQFLCKLGYHFLWKGIPISIPLALLFLYNWEQIDLSQHGKSKKEGSTWTIFLLKNLIRCNFSLHHISCSFLNLDMFTTLETNQSGIPFFFYYVWPKEATVRRLSLVLPAWC